MNEIKKEAKTIAIPQEDDSSLLFALDILSVATAISFTILLLLDVLSYLK